MNFIEIIIWQLADAEMWPQHRQFDTSQLLLVGKPDVTSLRK